jgi:hypothetical protein
LGRIRKCMMDTDRGSESYKNLDCITRKVTNHFGNQKGSKVTLDTFAYWVVKPVNCSDKSQFTVSLDENFTQPISNILNYSNE